MARRTIAARLRWLAGWRRRRNVELRLSLRMTTAGLLTFALAELFHLAQGYWAVFTAVIVTQGSVGGSLKATLDRFIGTLSGAAYGAVVASLIPHANLAALGAALALALAPLALVAAINAGFRVAPVTAIIVILGAASQQADPVVSAIDRVLEIGLGCLVGFGVSLFLLPARAHGLAAKATGRTLELLADLFVALIGGLSADADRRAVKQLRDRIRGALTRLDAVIKEAERERRSRLADEPDADPLLRATLRLRSDSVILGRAAGERLPEAVLARLAAPLGRVAEATGGYLREAGRALAARQAPPPLDRVLTALDTFAMAMAQLRQDGITRGLPDETVGRIFAVGFAFEELRRDLVDIGSRIGDFASVKRRWPPWRRLE